MSADNHPLDDWLKGGQAIADFLEEPYHRVQRMIAKKEIPAGKLGGILIASKRRLREAIDKIASGEA